MMILADENWFYCGQCRTVAYRFDCCGNTTCNGGGCDKCKEAWDEAWRRIKAGEAPSAESVPFCPPLAARWAM